MSNPPAARRSARGGLSVLFVTVALVFLARRVADDWPAARGAFGEASWAWMVLALVFAGAAMSTMAIRWRAVLAALGSVCARRDVVRWYFVGELGKYIPGGIFPLVGRAELARRGGVDRPTAYGSGLFSLALLYLACGGLGLVSLVVVAPRRWLVILALAASLVGAVGGLHPGVSRGLRNRIPLVARLLPPLPPLSTTLRLTTGYLPAWVAVLASNLALARSLGADVGVMELGAATFLSWYAGFLAVPFPGGLGIRESVFVTLLAGAAPGIALAVAVGSRAAFLLVDLAGAAIAALLPPSERLAPGSPRHQH